MMFGVRKLLRFALEHCRGNGTCPYVGRQNPAHATYLPNLPTYSVLYFAPPLIRGQQKSSRVPQSVK